MKKSNFALRLQPSLMEEAKRIAKAEGVAVNQLINVAIAEKVSALRTEEYFAERAARGDLKKAMQVLKRRVGERRAAELREAFRDLNLAGIFGPDGSADTWVGSIHEWTDLTRALHALRSGVPEFSSTHVPASAELRSVPRVPTAT